ncbi:MAG: RpoH suppressor SuhR [Elainellaceae cyanobacterium]
MYTIDASAEVVADYAKPERECDLVMKGGITSGIVYPPAVLKLAGEGKYRFRSVGGTSAGAIAAAVTVAAEYGREQGGFEKLEDLSKKLSEPGFLFRLFRPHPTLKPLMYIALALLGKLPPDLQPEAQAASTTTGSKTAEPGSETGKPLPALQVAQTFVNAVRSFHPQAANQGSRSGILVGLIAALILVAVPTLICFVGAQVRGSLFSLWGFVVWFIALGMLFGFIGHWLGILGSGVIHLYNDLFTQLPQNMFGICLGHQPEPNGVSNPDSPVLTDWLSVNINDLAGKPKTGTPLTFGDLNQKPYIPLSNQPRSEKPKVNIDLRMVTSNLSQNQPYTLPFAKDHEFLFHEDEFCALFPSNVVKHLIDHQGQRDRYRLADSKFHFLPDPDQLPIVVAMRMSLSFPVLISAVPLYTICKSAADRYQGNRPIELQVEDLQKNWFSDGGICSNFPIHFFDAWLPSRPTFGINLETVSTQDLEKPIGQGVQTKSEKVISDRSLSTSSYAAMGENAPAQKHQIPDVYLPEPDDQQLPAWVNIADQQGQGNLVAFVWQIFLTAQSYRDTMQAFLPGYRERIVQVRLTDKEGGLNLGMSSATIDRVMKKGAEAGNLMNGFNFSQHKWVRFRVLMSVLEEKLKETYQAALKPDPDQPEQDKFGTNQLLEAAQNPGNQYPFPYPSGAHWQKAEECADRIRQSIELFWKDEAPDGQPLPSLEDQAPQPKPVLRTTPEL